jgi:hypothetical protein
VKPTNSETNSNAGTRLSQNILTNSSHKEISKCVKALLKKSNRKSGKLIKTEPYQKKSKIK